VPPPKWSMPAPFPSRLTPPTATKLLFAQWWNGLHIRPELGDPLDEYVPPRIMSHQNVVPRNHQPRGGEGVDPGPAGDAATGPFPWKIFLKQLAAIDKVEIIELKLLKVEDRKALVRMAWLEEEVREREIERNRERVRRQERGEAAGYMSRKSVPKLVERAKGGNKEAIGELERRGWDGGEIARMREVAERKSARMREVALERWASGGGVGEGSKRGGEEMKKEEGKVNERAEGAADRGARGTDKGAAVRLGKPAGQLEEARKMGGGEGKVGEEVAESLVGSGVKKGIERELEVIRVGPNPRILTCRYQELASERVCKVGVRTVANFVRGMKFRMVEPVNEIEYAGVWRYEGRLPRLKGRW